MKYLWHGDSVRAMWVAGVCLGFGAGGATQKFLGEPWVSATATGLIVAMLIALLYAWLRGDK